MSIQGQAKSRVILLFIAALFVGPVFFAGWLYYKGELIQPAGRANNGALLEPVIHLADVLPESPLYEFNPGFWLLTYQNRGTCDEACELGLYTTRQLRLMLGKDIGRVRRIFLHGETLPDTVFLSDEHKGLISLQEDELSDVLDQKRPNELTEGGYFLIDPHGNLVMYFHPGLAPGDIVDDMKRLLKLSRIG